MDYDKFQVGDKVWSEAYGFGHIFNTQHEFADACFDSKNGNWRNLEILHSGQLHFFHDRPRTFFHAVADTDEGMREAIARGEGLKRPVPRGRFEFEKDDIVIYAKSYVAVGEVEKIDLYASHNVLVGLAGKDGTYYFTEGGKEFSSSQLPEIMRLLSKDEQEKANSLSTVQAVHWMMEEAIKENWHEKYGKGEHHEKR